ncbi:MAG TPA: DNA cytosine methyltransferase [Solirubrobacterales bacterium]|nr:DNA cytosine methyltransferase [Solirubrobacterales bacterium]
MTHDRPAENAADSDSVVGYRRSLMREPDMQSSPGELQFLEFFAGTGLIHEALGALGWTAVFANDNDPKKRAAYQANFPEVPFSEADIRDLDPRSLPDAELASASFPCVDISRAGGRVGLHGESSGLVWAFLEHIEALCKAERQPRYLLLENVPGLLSHSKNIDELLHSIASLGYGVDVVQVDAKNFTPQTRDRVFIVCVYGAERQMVRPAPPSQIRRYHVDNTYLRNPDLHWHHFVFPELPKRKIDLDSVMERLPSNDPLWWDADRLSHFWDRLENGHDERLKQMLAEDFSGFLTATRRGRRRGVREQIINVRFDRLASCLRTPKGGSSTQLILQIDNGAVNVRSILGIEAARLQGVNLSDSAPGFRRVGSRTDELFAFGDAVCVPAVRWVVEHSIMRHRSERFAPLRQCDLSVAG